jgi:hypothetical protein
MNNDIERRLSELRLPGPGPALRERVLAAVASELKFGGKPVRMRRRFRISPALAIVACLGGSLLLNHLVSSALDRRLARLLGPPLVPRQAAELAAEIASITDAKTGRWALARLTACGSQGSDPRHHANRLQTLIRELTADVEGNPDETPQENSQVGRDLRGSRDHPASGAERLVRLEHWNTA